VIKNEEKPKESVVGKKITAPVDKNKDKKDEKAKIDLKEKKDDKDKDDEFGFGGDDWDEEEKDKKPKDKLKLPNEKEKEAPKIDNKKEVVQPKQNVKPKVDEFKQDDGFGNDEWDDDDKVVPQPVKENKPAAGNKQSIINEHSDLKDSMLDQGNGPDQDEISTKKGYKPGQGKDNTKNDEQNNSKFGSLEEYMATLTDAQRNYYRSQVEK
jgi:hypothetical protein